MSLTPEQRSALWREDGSPWTQNRIVSARPGTGKTTTLTEYCLSLVQDWRRDHKQWQGMAVVSYTNVARAEIERKIVERGRSGELLAAPHFVGTIDAFINQYIFLPFGFQLMQCVSRPVLVGPPSGIWRADEKIEKICNDANWSSPNLFDCYSLDRAGGVVRVDNQPRMIKGRSVTPTAVTAKNAPRVRGMKSYLWSIGYATQADANYLALQVLTNSPATAKALASRFPVLIVDEAQDLTEIQHDVLRHLQVAGHTQIVLVGDEYQAIYEWNTAKPELFLEKIEQPGAWNPKELTGTFRCSPAICKYLSAISDGDWLSPANEGKNQHYPEPVAIVGVPKKQERQEIKSAIDRMAATLSGRLAHSTTSRTKVIAALGRSRSDVLLLRSAFIGQQGELAAPLWQNRLTRDFLRVLHHLNQADYYSAFRAYELFLAICGKVGGRRAARIIAQDYLRSIGSPASYRSKVFTELDQMHTALPVDEVVSISDCLSAANVGQSLVSTKRLTPIRSEIASFGTLRSGENCPIDSLFADSPAHATYPIEGFDDARVQFSTIHGVKGETYDGVVFYVKAQTAKCGCAEGSNMWHSIVGHDLAACESKRLVYVALSRAAQILTIMVPNEKVSAWKQLGDL